MSHLSYEGEGELYKKIREMQHLQEFHVWYHDEIKKTLDGAKQEFPMSKELIQNLTTGPFVEGVFKDNPQKVAEWFVKQFGESK